MGHQPGVDVFVFVSDVTEASPELFSMEQSCVYEDGNNAGKAETVAKGEGGGQEQGGVGGVLCLVEGEVGFKDARDIVHGPRVVVAIRVTNWHVFEVVHARIVDS